MAEYKGYLIFGKALKVDPDYPLQTQMTMVSSVQLRSSVTYSGEWSLPQVAGRFAEISGSNATAALTLTCSLVLDAQKRGEPVGWATSRAL